jgi:hypothetical protein
MIRPPPYQSTPIPVWLVVAGLINDLGFSGSVSWIMSSWGTGRFQSEGWEIDRVRRHSQSHNRDMTQP